MFVYSLIVSSDVSSSLDMEDMDRPETAKRHFMSKFNIFESDFSKLMISFFEVVRTLHDHDQSQTKGSSDSQISDTHKMCSFVDFDIWSTDGNCWWKSMLVMSRY